MNNAYAISNVNQSQAQNRSHFLIDKMKDTPYLADDIFAELPHILKASCSHFENKRERDTYFLSALAVLSGMFPTVTGTYYGETVYANLYFMAVAPPASGKGVLSHARQLGKAVHDELLIANERNSKNYKKELYLFKHDPENCEMPEPPKFQLLFIPANSSTAAIIKYLHDSGGSGVLFDNEADTLSTVLKQEWGNFSDILRKGFHHEAIPSGRRNSSGYKETENPRFSVVLSGTPAQVRNMFPSAENGLVSRFLFYMYSTAPVWQDASPAEKPNLSLAFRKHATEVARAVDFINQSEILFELTAAQWKLHTETFADLLDRNFHLLNHEGSSMVKRLGLITYRIAMVLSILRKYETRDTSGRVFCSDTDFNVAFSAIKVLLQHSRFVFNIIPRAEFSGINEQQRTFYEMLPANRRFRKAEAMAVAQSLILAERTVNKYLKRFRENGLLKKDTRYGFYEKT